MRIILIHIYLPMVLFGTSCSRNTNNLSNHISINRYIEENFRSYEPVYRELNKEINLMVSKKLKSAIAQIGLKYRIDSLIVFNKSKTKLYSTLNTSYKEYKGSNDYIQSLYGVKIKGKWHVYLGYNLIAMRDGYKSNKYEPFTWEQLSFVAHEQMFGRFISFDSQGNVILYADNVDLEVDPEKIGGSSISQDGTAEERFLRLWSFNQSRTIDSLQYQQLLDEVNNPSPKEREPNKKITWWDKLWGAEELIFDSKEWKEYLNQKYGRNDD